MMIGDLLIGFRVIWRKIVSLLLAKFDPIIGFGVICTIAATIALTIWHRHLADKTPDSFWITVALSLIFFAFVATITLEIMRGEAKRGSTRGPFQKKPEKQEPPENELQAAEAPVKSRPRKIFKFFWDIAVIATIFALIAVIGLQAIKWYYSRNGEGLLQSRRAYSTEKCAASNIQDYETSDVGTLQITLREGCYDGPIKLPERWNNFEVFHSNHQGDWATVWCNNAVAPHPIHPAGEDFGPNEFMYCASKRDRTTIFYTQGHGTIRFRAIDYKQ